MTESAIKAGVPIHFLGENLSPYLAQTVVNGPFLARAQAEALAQAAQAGARLFFPFGLPKYDENLSPHRGFEGTTTYGSTSLGPVIRVTLGKGECLALASPPPLEDGLWETFELWRYALMADGAGVNQ